MKYCDMKPGMYIIRTRELPWAKILSGAICLVEQVDAGGNIVVRLTADCVPTDNAFSIPNAADDGYWARVTDLVLEANSSIRPVNSECAFISPVASTYRNFLGLGSSVQPITPKEAVGQICLIGESKDGQPKFSRTGLYVIAVDDEDFTIAYQGYCDHQSNNENRKLNLRILNLRSSGREMYPAQPIVDSCAEAYKEDCELAAMYTRRIQEDTMASSTDSMFSGGAIQSIESLNDLSHLVGVGDLNLED